MHTVRITFPPQSSPKRKGVVMESVIDCVFFFGSLIGMGAVWFVLPTLIVFPLLHRLRRGVWRSPCNFMDVLTVLSVCGIWVYFSGKDSMGRGFGWFVDLIVIGAVYGLLITLRTPIIWLKPRCRMMASLVTFVLTDVAMLFFALTGVLGKE